ncbi:phosphohistidine phosphatase SixA [Moraxella atlantae]|uniref:Phosphohistidine phosphatase SixA n=1 Tax=Faucicola atlantae TaxID=34059 RepID=A0A1B8QCA3_9GAMM|nr:phosphohistidine phosphatase SixA [Moraxella atlantae]OBX78410.1 phosphohistidine phosphatase SixA [Moraxella atlantae]
MQIILVRHGDAGAYTQPDSERNLSDLGRAQARQTADWLAQHYQPTLFIHSPYNRAEQTCEILHSALTNAKDVPVWVNSDITPDDDAKQAVDSLAAQLEHVDNLDNACVVVVFHMNIIANVAAILTGNEPNGFSLAEARVLHTEVFAPELAEGVTRFVPQV